jgi:phosphate transport system substrate-binding protein
VSFGYLDDSVKTLSVDGVAPTAANAANGSYPVVRPLLMLSKGEPTPLASAWLDFIMSADGQALVVEDGYIAVP